MKRKSRCLKITEKSLIQHCERSELSLHFEWTKAHFKNAKKISYETFWVIFKHCENG